MRYLLYVCFFVFMTVDVLAESVKRNFIVTVINGLEKEDFKVYDSSVKASKMPFLNEISQQSYVFNSFYIEKDAQASVQTLLQSRNRYNLSKNGVNVWKGFANNNGYAYQYIDLISTPSCADIEHKTKSFLKQQKQSTTPFVLILNLTQPNGLYACNWSLFNKDQFLAKVSQHYLSGEQLNSTSLFVSGVENIVGEGVFSRNSKYLVAEEISRRSPAFLFTKGMLEESVYKDDMVHLMDIFPTAVSLMMGGIFKGESLDIDGINIYEYLISKTKKSPRTQFLYFNNQAKLYAIRFKDYKVWVNSKGVLKAFVDI